MGGGCGRGMGGARGKSGVMAPAVGTGLSREQTLSDLKEQAANLRQQMAAVEEKIRDLEPRK